VGEEQSRFPSFLSKIGDLLSRLLSSLPYGARVEVDIRDKKAHLFSSSPLRGNTRLTFAPPKPLLGISKQMERFALPPFSPPLFSS